MSAKQEMRLLSMIENYLRMRMSDDQKSSQINLSLDYLHPNANIPNYIQLCFNKTTQYGNSFCINKSGLQELISNPKLLAHFSLEIEAQENNHNQNPKTNAFLSNFSRIRKCHIFNWKICGSEYESYFSNNNNENNQWIECQTIHSLIIADQHNHSFESRFHFEVIDDKDDHLLWCKIRFDELPSAISNVQMQCGIYIPETQSEAYSTSYVTQSKKYISALHSIVSGDLLSEKTQIKQEFNLKILIIVWNVVTK
jgi:hypothetical protein